MLAWADSWRAWLMLCGALALHVADEAATGFLGVYNPTVLELRNSVPWLPMPVFRFDVWLGGLALAIAALAALTPAVKRGAPWVRPLMIAVAVLMIFNALGHAAGTMAGRTFPSIHFPRPMPGFYSSPLLLAASVYVLARVRA